MAKHDLQGPYTSYMGLIQKFYVEEKSGWNPPLLRYCNLNMNAEQCFRVTAEKDNACQQPKILRLYIYIYI